MPFDGVDYADALEIPKVVTHPWAPLVGACYGQGLRNSYFRERHHGQGGPMLAVPGDFERAPSGDGRYVLRGAPRSALGIVAEETRWVPGHYTHALAQCVFLAVSGEGGLSGWALQAGSAPGTILDLGATIEVPVTAESPARIPAQANLPGDTNLVLFEAVAGVELANTPLDALVHLRLRAGADEEDEDGNRVAVQLELLSFSFWFESVG